MTSNDRQGLPQRAVRTESVTFDGDTFTAVIIENEGIAVPVRFLCEAIGLDAEREIARIREHDVLSLSLRMVRVPSGGQLRSVAALLSDSIPYWLAIVPAKEVRDEQVRAKLKTYQEDLRDLLAAVYGGTVPSTTDVQALQQQIIAQARELQQLRASLTAQLQQLQTTDAAHDTRLTQIEGVLDERLGELSQRVSDQQSLIDEYTPITAAQQQYIKGTIQAIAQRHKQTTGQDIFAKLFGEFTWRMGAPRYDAVPARKYSDALAWLREKAQELGYPDLVKEQQEGLF
jgi:hypothetical protein